MELQERLRRVTDLFVEGTELYLGDDDDGVPVLAWVNKLNTFQLDEARRDGMSARAMRILQLRKEDNPELINVIADLKMWDTEALIDARVSQDTDKYWLEATNEIDGRKDWREKLDLMRRLPTLLQDRGVDKDDPRHEQLSQINADYYDAIAKSVEKQVKARKRELKDDKPDQLIEDFLTQWRERQALDDFHYERRLSELWFALRDCQGTRQDDGWSHTTCNHGRRLVAERSEIRLLPDQVILKATETMDNLTTPSRIAGNSAAPESSSASSEQPNAAEASAPSTQEETSPEPPTN